MNPANLIGLLVLVIGVPLNLLVVVRLLGKSRARPDLQLLRKDLIAAGVILAHVLVYGLIFVNNDMPIPWLDLAATKIITRAVELVLATVSAAIFLWLYRRRRD